MRKPGGGRRRLNSFRQGRIARSNLIKDVVTAQGGLHAGQYATTSAGLPGAYRRIMEIIADPAIKWVASADIRSFYDTINTANLGSQLGLPQAVIDANISFVGMVLHHRTDIEDSVSDAELPAEEERLSALGSLGPIEVDIGIRHDRDVQEEVCPRNRHSRSYRRITDSRRGIPQGATSSPIIGEKVVAGTLHGFADDIIAVTWVDNIFLFGTSRAGVEEAAQTLRANMLAAPTGPFTLRDESIHRVADGFDAIGGHFRRQHGRASFRPTAMNLSLHQTEVRRFLAMIAQTGRGASQAKIYVRAWSSTFALWENCAAQLDQELGFIRDIANAHASACNPLMLRTLLWLMGGESLLRTPYDPTVLWLRASVIGPSGARIVAHR